MRSRLSECLSEKNHELACSLGRSWKIAMEEWLPSIKPKMGSYNSLPHLYGVENQLNTLLASTIAAGADNETLGMRLNFSPIELYMLLAAVLFHDIGRTIEGAWETQSHPELTERLLLERHPELGIDSPELAQSLARICLFHDPPQKRTLVLCETVIEPYGPVRERYIGTLLRLADHLDDTATRAMPEYLISKLSAPVGEFRRSIPGTSVCLKGEYAKTVLSDKFMCNTEEDKEKWQEESSELRKPECYSYEIQNECPKKLFKGLGNKVKPDIFPNIKNRCKSEQADSLRGYPFSPPCLCIANGIVVAKREHSGSAPRELLLAIAANDTRRNALDLAKDDFKNGLRAMGIPLQTWLLECQERLYRWDGKQTFEPIFKGDYLATVLLEMWSLFWGIFGAELITYEALAAQLRDPDIERVRMAVRRLSIIFSDYETGKQDFIQYGEQGWCIATLPAKLNSLALCLDVIKNLEKPIDEDGENA
ncbi:MAG: HD domain-containing protein [Victivallaceae bacterium]